MSRRLIVTLLVVALVSLVAFVMLRLNAPPPGIEAKGDESSLATAQLVSLTTSVVSLLTAIVGLIKTMR